jgi:hypothetical protein
MATHYLLPCPCGKKTEIDSSQAGLTLRCTCGAELTVPAMRGLANLERLERAPAAPATGPSSSTWGRRQGTMFLGGVILTISALMALYFWMGIPPRPELLPDYEAINRQQNEQLTLEDSFTQWHEILQKGITDPAFEARLDFLDQITERIMQWEMVCGGFAAIGLVFIVVGLLMPSGQQAAARRPKAVKQALPG